MNQSDFNDVIVIRTMNHRLIFHSVADNNWPSKYENIISKEPIKSLKDRNNLKITRALHRLYETRFEKIYYRFR